jgi:hypothetical protein
MNARRTTFFSFVVQRLTEQIESAIRCGRNDAVAKVVKPGGR